MTTDVRNFAPDELLVWSEHIAEQEFLVNSPEGSEAGVYPHEIRKPTEEEISKYYVSHGGSRCPYCLEGDIEGSSVVTGNGQAHQDVSCNECGA